MCHDQNSASLYGPALPCDTDGRPVWTKDADGFITFTEYDVTTGAVTKTIVDVDTAQVSNEASGWTIPGGGGLRVASLGRPTKQTDPNGNVTHTVYSDANHEVRVYCGWTGSGLTASTTGPINITREYRPAANAAVGQRVVGVDVIECCHLKSERCICPSYRIDF